jgi:hypothetical protein
MFMLTLSLTLSFLLLNLKEIKRHQTKLLAC